MKLNRGFNCSCEWSCECRCDYCGAPQGKGFYYGNTPGGDVCAGTIDGADIWICRFCVERFAAKAT